MTQEQKDALIKLFEASEKFIGPIQEVVRNRATELGFSLNDSFGLHAATAALMKVAIYLGQASGLYYEEFEPVMRQIWQDCRKYQQTLIDTSDFN